MLPVQQHGGVNQGTGAFQTCPRGQEDTYFTREEHIQEALKPQHPVAVNTCVEDEARKVWFETLAGGPGLMATKLEEALRKMMELQLSLEEEETVFRANVPSVAEEVTKGKRFVLFFRRLLGMTKFPDMEVCELLESGGDLVGDEKESPLFEKCYRPMRLRPDQLASQAPFRKAMARDMFSGCTSHDFPPYVISSFSPPSRMIA